MATVAPTTWADTNPAKDPRQMPAKESLNMRPKVAARLTKGADEVNQ